MAQRVTGRKKILTASSASPERVNVLETYCYPAGIDVSKVGFLKSGTVDMKDFDKKLNNDVAAVYLEVPNFLGVIEDSLHQISEKCRQKGALLIAGVNPITLGVLSPPSSYGADIVVGDGQSLGLYPNFGGPLMGIFAIRDDPVLLRQMPGRLDRIDAFEERIPQRVHNGFTDSRATYQKRARYL